MGCILVKDGIQINNITCLPSVRGIAGVLEGINMINIYAPSGAEKKAERETFYNKDILQLLPTTNIEILLAGDFNCTLKKADTTSHTTPSKALTVFINGLKLQDKGQINTNHRDFTHFTTQGAARIDRIYISPNLKERQQRLETKTAAFTDHKAVFLKIATDDKIVIHGRGYWRMNNLLLHDNVFQHSLLKKWTKWRAHQRFYPDKVTCWERYAKLMIKRHFQREGAERRRERRVMENFYYAALNDALEAPIEHVRKAIMLKRLKARIRNLHYQEGQKLKIQMEDSEMKRGEDISIYQ